MPPHDFISNLSLIFVKDLSVQDFSARLSNWTGLTLVRGYDFYGIEEDFYECRVFGMSLIVKEILHTPDDNKTIEQTCCQIGLDRGENDFQPIQILAIFLLFQVVYRRLGVKAATIEQENRTIADYYTRSGAIYDRVSSKLVRCPQHLLDLYTRIQYK